MRQLNDELKSRKIVEEKLLAYGFVKEKNKFVYEKAIMENKFRVIVTVTDCLKMTSILMEIENKEEYLLVDVLGPTGKFIGKVKEEYDGILEDILDNCTVLDVFKSDEAKKIIQYIKEKYNDDLEFLWPKFPQNAIWRNKENQKWYGALLIIPANKIGIDSLEMIEIIDLRYPKEEINKIIDYKTIFPGFHMNKNNWITIKLDKSLEIEKITEFIDNSYTISLKK